mmetsp:Transcript_12973/g.15835  ORF Transcript_12973/g.15835 Transcript_12973/m.15835 type:complete len:183 (-) Transcript_12973:63-611(-)
MKLDIYSKNDTWSMSGNGPKVRIIHHPPKVVLLDSEGEDKIFKQSDSYCVPEIPTPAASLGTNSSLVAIADVGNINIMLPDKDKRKLGGGAVNNGSLNSVTREENTDLLFVNWRKKSRILDDHIANKIKLPKGKLRHVSIHPDGEWIVLAIANQSNNSLYLINLRDKCNICVNDFDFERTFN